MAKWIDGVARAGVHHVLCSGAGLLLIALFLSMAAVPSRAQESVVISITVKNHQFQPAEVHAPANRPITLRIRNQDSVPVEFESVKLRVEKVIAANSEGTINIRPLAPGRYNFLDDFHQSTKGVLVVQ
jgi:hypothetical protein